MLIGNDELFINCNDSRRPCLMWVAVWREYSMIDLIFNKDDSFFFIKKLEFTWGARQEMDTKNLDLQFIHKESDNSMATAK